ncbi:MAG: hypothetical protein IT258_04425, partial [Saprospiraceae bacterium]|nr:hypothetical protein [Saprospiraceae bacterium]
LLKAGNLEFQLCDEQGRVMATQTAQSEVTIIQNLAPLSSGIYYLTALKDGVPMRSITVYK